MNEGLGELRCRRHFLVSRTDAIDGHLRLMVYERSNQTRWSPGLTSLLLYDFVNHALRISRRIP